MASVAPQRRMTREHIIASPLRSMAKRAVFCESQTPIDPQNYLKRAATPHVVEVLVLKLPRKFIAIGIVQVTDKAAISLSNIRVNNWVVKW